MKELTGDQIRIHTNATQIFESWLEAERTFRHSYDCRLNWSGKPGKQYLYRISGNIRKSLGARSPETEKLQSDYQAQRKRLRDRRSSLKRRLDELARVNKAYRLGRVPTEAAKIIRALDAQGILEKSLTVVGTFSMFAYEAEAGVHLQDDIIATEDIDLLWDVRRRLRLIGDDWPGLLGVLRGIDKTFEREAKTFRASNNRGFMVDLIRPHDRDEMLSDLGGLGNENDLVAAAISGLDWLVAAPKFSSIAIDESGHPVRIACIDPRAFALHKAWLSSRSENREAKKRRRDLAQAKAAASIARDYLSLGFTRKELAALPAELRAMASIL